MRVMGVGGIFKSGGLPSTSRAALHCLFRGVVRTDGRRQASFGASKCPKKGEERLLKQVRN